jgi:4-hydroxybenzoate polyprenyltransferase
MAWGRHAQALLSHYSRYWRLMRLHRPIGIWLLLWPTLWALWIASVGRPDAKVFLILVLGTIVVRSAGCVINDFADRKIDPHVARTADRPLATGEVAPAEALLLFLATVIWVVVYDTQYAMTDRPDDAKIGVRSTAILFGDLDRVFIAGLQALFLTSLVLVGRSAAMGPWYYAGLIAAGLFCAYQAYLIKERDLVQSFRAFLNNAWLGGAVFAGILLDYTFRP